MRRARPPMMRSFGTKVRTMTEQSKPLTDLVRAFRIEPKPVPIEHAQPEPSPPAPVESEPSDRAPDLLSNVMVKRPPLPPRDDGYCGARTRAGTPCKSRTIYQSGRCKNHGGMSTGPKTAEGKARSALNGRVPKKRTPRALRKTSGAA